MKLTKMFFGNQYVGAFKCDGRRYSKWQVRRMKTEQFIKRSLTTAAKICIIAWMVVGGMKFGQHNAPTEKVYADRIVEVVKNKEFPAILTKICSAESGGKQFKSNGDVVRGVENKSDIGYCQINEYIWNDQARKLGYDIYTEEGNKAMAIWILEHYGSEPWYLSKHNWK